MNLKDLEHIFHQELDAIYGKEEVSSFFFTCTESFFNISRLQLALDHSLSITKAEQEPIFKALDDLKNERPIQYILGTTEFYGLPFQVNEHTLIPRPETEELVDWVIKDQNNNTTDQFYLLDIGTGSGCIAISLAKNLPTAKVFALDISKEALQKANENAKHNKVKVEFIESSILEQPKIETHFDVIVSNPPYVRHQEKVEMKTNVLDNEPHLALFVENENPLQFYKAIVTFAQKHLKANGKLYFEINEYLGQEMIELLSDNGFKDIQLKKDMFNKDRMLKGTKA